MDDFVAYPSPWRIALLVFLCAGFIGIALWMIGTFGDVPSTRRYPAGFSLVIGWICLVFFGFCSILHLRRAFSMQEELRINGEGIRSAIYRGQLIAWSDIQDVTTWNVRSQRGIALYLRDPSRFPSSLLWKVIAKPNQLLGGGHISISLTGTDKSFDEAMAAIDRFRSV